MCIRDRCMAIIDSQNVADICDYPVKSYLTRVRENGRSYDVAVVARQDQMCIRDRYDTRMETVKRFKGRGRGHRL